jgi:nitrogenase subunit NifH
MRQNAIYSPGDIDSSRNSRYLTTAPATLRMRIKQKSLNPKMTSTCLPLGGMIKATLPEITHVDSVGPEPGVGYGWSLKGTGQTTMNNRFRMITRCARVR